jgi:N-acetylneuraminate synthase
MFQCHAQGEEEGKMDIAVIAELGINYNGDLAMACHMASVARDCGADFIKLQKRDPDWCYTDLEMAMPCKSPWGTTVEDKVRGRELNWDQIHKFDEHCKAERIRWFSSCFDLKSLRELHEFFPDRPWNKIPSAMARHKAFVREVAKQKIPTLISAGLSKDEELDEITSIFELEGCKYVVNHCIALYPSPDNRLELEAIPIMWQRYGEAPKCLGIGYSGHERGILPSVMAARMGARWIERHFTLDRTAYGADQAASLEPEGFRRMCRDIRRIPEIIGSGNRNPRGDEKIPVTNLRMS